jgi:hypothetical protein
MFISYRAILMALCALAVVLVGWRLILPLGLMYIGGLGVESPIPKRVVIAYPRLAAYLFVLGGPILFIGLLIVLVWLARAK